MVQSSPKNHQENTWRSFCILRIDDYLYSPKTKVRLVVN